LRQGFLIFRFHGDQNEFHAFRKQKVLFSTKSAPKSGLFCLSNLATFAIPFGYSSGSGSGSGTVINYNSSSDFLAHYGSGSASLTVTVPTVPVPHRWLHLDLSTLQKPVLHVNVSTPQGSKKALFLSKSAPKSGLFCFITYFVT
jgi:hypothetical protein